MHRGGERRELRVGFGVRTHGRVAVPSAPLRNGGDGGTKVKERSGTASPKTVPGGTWAVRRGEGTEEAGSDGSGEKRTRFRPGAEEGGPGEQGKR